MYNLSHDEKLNEKLNEKFNTDFIYSILADIFGLLQVRSLSKQEYNRLDLAIAYVVKEAQDITEGFYNDERLETAKNNSANVLNAVLAGCKLAMRNEE